MKAAFLALGTLGLQAGPPVVPPPPISAAPTATLPTDPRDQQPLLLGPTTAKEILAHRAVFRENLARTQLPGDLKARWQAVKRPLILVAVFGSWCGDSQYQLPDLLALEAEPHPFIEVHYLGVNRDKQLADAQWPRGCEPQTVLRVPTFYLFATQPGGGEQLVGTVVENPPRAGQRMAEALVELVEASAQQP
ncbi:thioredoxin family protein [Geothrix oryzisoli]|uniref:thioredoxin family protein n=1 Tax=Geothrix oryzisoli TaxID=2922721 RepID=UPI001FAE2152|nr:thioredoxin family protein [Geothrix oryzisoli]